MTGIRRGFGSGLPAGKGVAGAEAPWVLVTGGAGYIGSVLVRKLLAARLRVRVLDSLLFGLAPLRDLLGRPGFELRAADCRDGRAVASAADGVQSVVHLAAIVGDQACDQDPRRAAEINHEATARLIEAALRAGVERFVFASSCSVYGAADSILDERSAAAPVSTYGATKAAAERIVLGSAGPGFHPVVLRLATVFGPSPRPRFDLVVNLLAARAWGEGRITIHGGEQWRPFLHVSDVAAGFLSALQAPAGEVSGEIFNLGDSRLNFTLREVGVRIRRVFPQTKVEYVGGTDRRNYRVSFEKIRRRLGFRARRSLECGIAQIRRLLNADPNLDRQWPVYHNHRRLSGGEPGPGGRFGEALAVR